MNKAIIIASIALSIVLGYQSAFAALTPADYTEPEISIEIPEETIEKNQNEIPEEILDELVPEFLEDGYMYISSNADYLVIFPGKEWYTEFYEPITFFFNYNTLDSYSSLALSSSIVPVSEDDQKTYTDEYMSDVAKNAGNIAYNIELSEMENYNFIDYTAYRYSITATLSQDEKTAVGEYLFWWIDNRGYVCSLFASQDDYVLLSSAMYDMLDTFQQPSTLE